MQAHLLKISTLESSRAAEMLRLEGHLGGPWVDELRHSCDRVLSEGKQLTLELSDVSFIDHDGIKLLRRLRRTNVELRNCSPFVALQLREDRVE